MRNFARRFVSTVVQAALVFSVVAPAEVGAADGRQNFKDRSVRNGSRTSIQRPSTRPAKIGGVNANRGDKRRDRNARRGNNNVIAGNTVVVNRPPAGRPPYYGNNGGYYVNNRHDRWDNDRWDDDRWDDDDDDFGEFIGKTIAITAGAALVGSIIRGKPDGDCKESVSNGQVYLYCNGTWYQPVQSGNDVNYRVVEQP